MFNYISAHKNAYHKGQLFPFMLAVVVVLLIMLIITINLGQLSVFKTDTSNAADGGALAGASSISSSLLGLGNANDMMAGEAYVCLCMAIGFMCTYIGIAAGIALLITHISKSVLIFVQEMGATIEGLAKARQNAIQYAWQNIGVDEPRPSMGMFLYRILEQMNRYDPGMSPPGLYNYGIFDSTTHRYFSEYVPYTDVSKQGTDISTTPAQLMQDCLNNRNGCTVDDLATFQHIYETGYDDNPAYQITGTPVNGNDDPNIRYQFKVGSALNW